MRYDYLIVGAGLFGATFAHEAALRGKKCLVIDKRGHVAGNAFTEQVSGVTVHRYGAHIFHTSDERVWRYVNQFARFNPFVHAPLASYKGELFNLPFNMNTFYRLWGVKTPSEARAEIARQVAREHIGEPKNLEEQALSLVGRDVYEKLVRGYTEKQWGRPCGELPAFIIRRLPLRFTFDNNYFSDRYQGIPEGGYTPMVRKMLEGADVRLETDYYTLREREPDVARKTVYTGMIDEFFDFRLGALAYRSVRFETETLDTDDYQGCAVVNYTDSAVPYTRIIEHRHFEPGGQSRTVISREYPMEWKRGIEPYYPVNDGRNNALYDAYRALARRTPDVIFGGRLGEYRYFDMDRVIASALELAARELGTA